MTPENFAYWLRGMLETRPPEAGLTDKDVATINAHLDLVLRPVTRQPTTVPRKPTPAPMPTGELYTGSERLC